MYAQHFGLTQDPFSIAPDPRYLFMSERHREALAHLLYGLGGGGGFVLLSGEIGTGKTTVCRCFLEQIPAGCNVAYIFNPKLTVIELLQSVCDEFHIDVPARGTGAPTAKDYIDPLNAFLLRTHAAGQNNVLIIDEAQNLSADVLEQLRLLTNLETNERKLLQIVLIGQPELRRMLARPELEQLAQRVIARFHLDALTEAETGLYIRHRLAVAGHTGGLPFDDKALRRIHQLTGGVPRRINLLCDRALLGGYAHGSAVVTRKIVDKAAGEVFDQESTGSAGAAPRRLGTLGLALGGGLVAGAALFALLQRNSETTGAGGAAMRGASAPAVASSSSAAVKSTISSAAVTASAPASAAVQEGASNTLGDATTALQLAVPAEADAWRELAGHWKLAPGAGDPCLVVRQQQAQCFQASKLSLAVVRQLGRPGILTLHDSANRNVFAVLTALGDSTATLSRNGVTSTVPLHVLAGMWRGDFATLWRTPAGYAGAADVSRTALVTQWLVSRLAQVQNTPPDAAGQPDAATLRSRIALFQVAQGLTPDGVAGPMTFMQLNRATGVDEPRLLTQPR